MNNPKDILVTTTSSVEGLTVKQYLKPISAHVVAGTNLFSDFLGSFSDIFGGRSQTYQNQLTSLYNEAIERLKLSAHEIGANCIIGLNIDLDEISGKGKSMFMLTAVGTAVIIESGFKKDIPNKILEKFENVGVDRIKTLKTKRTIIEKANEGRLTLEDNIWDFIITNQVDEIYDYVIGKLQESMNTGDSFAEAKATFYKRTLAFVDSFRDDKKIELLYSSINKDQKETLTLKIANIIKDLQLLDLNQVTKLLQDEDFQKQKLGLRIITYDKPFYNKKDIEEFYSIIKLIKQVFKEKGVRSMKKQMLSSKEKEVWTCECGKSNDIGSSCGGCTKDINGFKDNEVTAMNAISKIEEKISLIEEYLE